MKNKTKTVTISSTPILFLFLFLKLSGIVNWSWWWIFSPLWLPFAIFFGFIIFAILWVFLLEICKGVKK